MYIPGSAFHFSVLCFYGDVAEKSTFAQIGGSKEQDFKEGLFCDIWEVTLYFY
jgi:hypothetical protein